ncbi:MAG: phosphotyrosine protein phosphatase [Pseudomonadota bacterium]|nr:phosphotyrosine protein phosphatase [Pseudomonadota bacterium]
MTLSEKIKNRYGSKRGLLRYVKYEVLRMLGVYSRLKKIDYSSVTRLVFVCKGNICRSPLAEVVARKHNVPTISFGLSTRGGDPADSRAIAWASANGYDLAHHITTRVDQYQPQAGDLLIGMEPMHVDELAQRFIQSPVQITMLGLWLPQPLAYLHDPFNTNAGYFDRCEKLVLTAVLQLNEKLS